MFSLESFYSVLYSNLLKPANFYYQYFYPFGSTRSEDLHDFSNIDWNVEYRARSLELQHMCIAFDQEPLLPAVLNDNFYKRVSNKFCFLFANSEKSTFKNTFLTNNGYMNWYYFFHGFAALDWYRNFKYINLENKFDYSFMSLNRIWQNDRSYRLGLISKLKNNNLLDKGIVSLHANNFVEIKKQLADKNCQISTYSKKLVYKALIDQELPILADRKGLLGDASALGSLEDLKFNKSALWHITSETVFYYDKLHLTEKIFKPIVSKRPFILVGATGNLQYLKDYGFQTFDQWIDESYDLLTDHDERIDAVVEQLTRISTLDNNQLRKMHYEMQEVLDYNYNHFYNGSFRYKISKELIDNFRGCCVAWNQNMCREPDMIPIWNVDFDRALSTLIR